MRECAMLHWLGVESIKFGFDSGFERIKTSQNGNATHMSNVAELVPSSFKVAD